MAVVSVREKHDRRRSSDRDGKPAHTRVYLVRCGDPHDGTAAALFADDGTNRVPRYGERVGNLIVTSVDADPVSGSAVHFDVSVELTDPGDDEAEQERQLHPLSRPPEVSWGSSELTEPYFLDASDTPKPVANSAGEAFEQFLERERGEAVITVTVNEAAHDAAAADAFSNTVNKAAVTIVGTTYAAGTLKAMETVSDARRRGIDPITGMPPRTHSAREKLRRLFQEEPGRLERSFQNLTGVYEDGFGNVAAEAFTKAVRARNAGIEVVSEGVFSATVSPDLPTQVSPTAYRRTNARLPVPRPLPAAVNAGRFGLDEHGKPIRPGPDEVRAITERHAEKLIDLFDQVRQEGRSLTLPAGDHGRLYVERERLTARVREAVAMYTEDFGKDAAQQLERYARSESRKDERGR